MPPNLITAGRVRALTSNCPICARDDCGEITAALDSSASVRIVAIERGLDPTALRHHWLNCNPPDDPVGSNEPLVVGAPSYGVALLAQTVGQVNRRLANLERKAVDDDSSDARWNRALEQKIRLLELALRVSTGMEEPGRVRGRGRPRASVASIVEANPYEALTDDEVRKCLISIKAEKPEDYSSR